MAKRKTGDFIEVSFKFDKNQVGLIHNIISSINSILKDIEISTFNIGITGNEEQKVLRYSLTNNISSKLGKILNLAAPDAYFLIDFNKNVVSTRLSPVFVSGNYCKYSRALAQTQHFARNPSVAKASQSVEQLLAEIFLPSFKALQLVFHGAGREDVDVLMLGKGRAFVAEIRDPKIRDLDLKKIEEKINSKFKDLISVNSLQFVEKDVVAKTKDTLHDKIYKVFIECEQKPNLEKLNKFLNKEIAVSQKTPTRVEMRRAKKERKKKITILEIKKINELNFEIKLKTSHGTYVKEFVSGDEGKTVPSISSMLGINCKCIQLDVLEIC